MQTVHSHTGMQSSEISLFPPTHLTNLGISYVVRNCGSTQGLHEAQWLYADALLFIFLKEEILIKCNDKSIQSQVF